MSLPQPGTGLREASDLFQFLLHFLQRVGVQIIVPLFQVMEAGDRPSCGIPRSAASPGRLTAPAVFLPARLVIPRLVYGADARLVPAAQDLVRVAVIDIAGRQLDDAAGFADDFGGKPVFIIPFLDQRALQPGACAMLLYPA